jgi:probable HAF family extracellular repeat protein
MSSKQLSCRVAALFACVVFAAHTQAAEFIPLGDLSGGSFGSEAFGIDDSGSFVVGSSTEINESTAFFWSDSQGLQPIPSTRQALAISANAKVVVGDAINPSTGIAEPFRWTTTGGLELLGIPLGEMAGLPTVAVDVSSDGSALTGTTVFGGNAQAYRWTDGEGFVGLSDLSGGTQSSAASAISADGRVIVGISKSPFGNEAFRWTISSGMEGIGDLPGGQFTSEAVGISPEGSVVVGTADSAAGREAFRWTETSGMEGLGFLSGSPFESVAIAATHSGQAIVGFSGIHNDMRAFVWTEVTGMLPLQDVLINRYNLAAELADWQLTVAHDISPDGHFIVGSGINPDGNQEAWLVRLDRPIFVPEPSALVLATLSLAALLCYHRPRCGEISCGQGVTHAPAHRVLVPAVRYPYSGRGIHPPRRSAGRSLR